MQHEQDAVEGGLIAHCELACATFGGGSEGGDQGLQLQPQFFANGLSCHEGMKHNCFMRVSWAVVLATLRVLYFPFSETTPCRYRDQRIANQSEEGSRLVCLAA